VLHIYQTVVLQKAYGTKHHKKHGAKESQVFLIYEFLKALAIHILDQEQSKIDDKSKRYIFIGYDSSSKGYKLYNQNYNKIVISRDMEFDEEDFWDWSIQEEEKYDLFPFLEEEEESRNEEFITPSPSPTNSSTPPSLSREEVLVKCHHT
jgi:hypothetical protein